VNRRLGFLLAIGGLAAGVAVAAALSLTVFRGEAERADFAQNAEFIKRGRPDIALCVSWHRGSPDDPVEQELSSRLESALGDNKRGIWRGSFLESEPLIVESPCPVGPTVDGSTTDVMEYITDLRVVDSPGPYAVYVFVVGPAHLEALDKLNVGRVVPHEYVDPDPQRPGGYEQVASAIYLSAEDYEKGDVLARRVAEALGCTEECAPRGQ
jgi:hypothetical protein